MQIFSSYKTKCGDFKRLFKELPETEQLIVGKSLPKVEVSRALIFNVELSLHPIGTSLNLKQIVLFLKVSITSRQSFLVGIDPHTPQE